MTGIPGLLGDSAAMHEVADMVRAAIASDVTVLVEGETGTGKEVVARALAPRGRPFVAINCSALPDAMLDAELFGHRRGAFTGADRDRPGLLESAHGGVAFLDEIATTSPALQARLLRVLENAEIRAVGADRSRSVDVRIVAASNASLEAAAARGTFRADLFYRLSVLTITLPPLRARRSDIPLLVEHFLRALAARSGGQMVVLAPEALDRLIAYDFPGNVRELRNELARAATLARGLGRVALRHLSPRIRGSAPAGTGSWGVPSGGGAPGAAPRSPAQAMRDLERQLVAEALEAHGSNVTRTAAALGMSRFGLRKRMRRLGIVVQRSFGLTGGGVHCTSPSARL